jgi:hypothetical protein
MRHVFTITCLTLIFGLEGLAYANHTSKEKTNTATQHADFRDYYRKIDLAELAICDMDFASANKYYADAFKINEQKAFYRDVINAFHAAMDSREYALAEKYLALLLQRGLDAENEAAIKNNYKDDDLTKLSNMFARHHNNIDKVLSDPLTKKLKALVQRDLDVRKYFARLLDGDYMVDSIYAVDVANARCLLKIFEKRGIPGEAVAAVTDYWQIMWHNTGMEYGNFNYNIFDTLLYKAVLNFDFDARMFAVMAEKNTRRHSFKYDNLDLRFPLTLTAWEYNNKRYLEHNNDTSEDRMNIERAKIGLEPLGDLRRKVNAYNDGKNFRCCLHKYALTSPMLVIEVADKSRIEDPFRAKRWGAQVKKRVEFKRIENTLGMGRINHWTINRSTYDSVKDMFSRGQKRHNESSIYFSSWANGRAQLRRGNHATIINNPYENLETETGRDHRAKLPAGYKYVVDWGADGWLQMRNIEMLFDSSGVLIYLKSNSGSFCSKLMISYCGTASSIMIKEKKIPWKLDPDYSITLPSKKYVWRKDNLRTIVTTTDELDETNNIVRTTTFEMMDAVKYQAYLDRVMAEKRRLDGEYEQKLGRK